MVSHSAVASRRLRARLLSATVLAVVGMSLWGVSVSSANAPWWHVSVNGEPTRVQPGAGGDEIQEVTVVGNGGLVGLKDPEAFEEEGVPVYFTSESASEVQALLETYLYGLGNVKVEGGPTATGATYRITFMGNLADRHVALMKLYTEEIFEGGGRGTATIVEKQVGAADGQIVVSASNLGNADANGGTVPITLTDTLPANLQAVGIYAETESDGQGDGSSVPLTCVLQTLSCTYGGVIAPYEEIKMVILVGAKEGAQGAGVDEASAAGGGAQLASGSHPIPVGGTPVSFGVESYEMSPENVGGTPDTQAGSHPYQLTTTLALNESSAEGVPALAKDLNFKLPAGLIGNPTPFPQCPDPQFYINRNAVNECPADTQVGVAAVTIDIANLFGRVTVYVPLFNLKPNVGEPARFGFAALGVPVVLDTSVRTGEDYGVTVSVDNIPQQATFFSSRVTFWGVPGDPSHDSSRGWSCIADEFFHRVNKGFVPACSPTEEQNPPPLLTMPTSCAGPMQTRVEADSWKEEGAFGTFASTAPMPTLDGCNRLQFTPSIKVTPDGQAGSTPTGLTVDEHVPQDLSLNGAGLSESAVKGLSVTLPEGVALNPAAADGLQACSEAQIGLKNDEPVECPEASKVATVKIKTPLLPNALEGAAYLATQDSNPFGSLVAMYVYAEDPVSGVRAKAAGEVVENPVTGQLIAHFEKDPVFANDPVLGNVEAADFLPQVPFEDIELHFFGGDRAPLSTPSLCGTYTTTGTFTPWSGTATTESSSTFDVVSGPNGSPCKDPLPFSPTLTAGTTSIQAGGFSPFTMTMSRPDGSQNLQAIKLKMPPGLLGTLASVKLCPEAQANAGTCGPESLIGHTIVSVGVGGDPYTVTGGQVFITEGYEGAPYGLSIVNPAKAGPFDLGKVIVRAKIEVDPLTAVLTITTDDSGAYKIPTIIDGIPLQIQHVNVTIDRPGFTFNPTNCSPLAVTGALYSSEGAVSSVSVPFQATNCAVLAFKPKLTAKTNGKTSRANGASLSVKLTYPAGPYDANIARVKVDLPKQLPSRLTTLQKACTAATFEANPANCPAASIVGHATATTPVMPVPLTGPAYFVSHAGEEFPSLIVVLQGYGATVHLVGTTYIDPKTSITSSTFKSVPDVPVGTFELTLPQGQFSALAATANLCTAKKLAMPTSFVGQNGAELHTSTPISATGCPKHSAKKKAKGKAKTKHPLHGGRPGKK